MQNQTKLIYSIHSLLGVIISETPKLAVLSLQLLSELLKLYSTNTSNPNKKSSNEKNRLRIMLQGLVPALLHTIIKTKDENIKKEAEEILNNDCYLKELEGNLKLLERYLATTPAAFSRDLARILPEIPQNKKPQDGNDDGTKTERNTNNTVSHSNGNHRESFPGRQFINYLYMEYANQQSDANREQKAQEEKNYILSE